MGDVITKVRKTKEAENGQPKEMINDDLRKALTKQGYKLIGKFTLRFSQFVNLVALVLFH